MTSYTWGKPTAPLDWCEKNYEQSWLFAEFWNTVSNIAFIVGGVTLLIEGKRHNLSSSFAIISIACILTGLASGLFHATLWWWGQKIDEIAETIMVMSLLYADINTSKTKSKLFAYFKSNYEILFVFHSFIIGILIIQIPDVFCEVNLISTVLAYGYRLMLNVQEFPKLKNIGINAVTLTLVGFTFWCVDRLFCSTVYFLQLHAWWHVFTALGMYNATIASFYVAVSRTDRKPVLRKTYGIRILPKILSQSASMA